MSIETQAAIVAWYVDQMATLREQVVASQQQALAAADGDYSDEAAVAYAAAVIPAMAGAQAVAAQLTAAYLAYMVADMTGKALSSVVPPVVDLSKVTGPALRNGLSQEALYRRPFSQARYEISKPKIPTPAPSALSAPSAPTTSAPAADHTPPRDPQRNARAASERRAETIGLTDLQLAANHTARDILSADQSVVGYRRVLTGAENCGMCVVAATRLYFTRNLMPMHPNCVPGRSRVRTRRILAATRRRYSGKLSVLTTSRDQQVAVTPNHPVLTDRGWVDADLIRPGDYLVSSGSEHWVRGSGPDERQAPALAEDVWSSLAVTFGFQQVPLASEDFHGDGSDGEVDVVRTDGYFAPVGNFELSQSVGERLLMPGHGGRIQLPGSGGSTTLVPSNGSSTNGIVRGGGLGLSLLDGHLCRAHEAGIRSAASGDLGFTEPALNDVARHPLLVREDVLGESVLDVVHPKLFDRVTDVGRVDFLDHVYNFQTELGTYESAGHIVHNCDCVVVPVMKGEDPGRSINNKLIGADAVPSAFNKHGVPIFDADQAIDLGDLLQEAHDAVARQFGSSYRDAKKIDYRKVITVHQHGELGPVLTVARHKFTKRQLRENDLRAV